MTKKTEDVVTKKYREIFPLCEEALALTSKLEDVCVSLGKLTKTTYGYEKSVVQLVRFAFEAKKESALRVLFEKGVARIEVDE